MEDCFPQDSGRLAAAGAEVVEPASWERAERLVGGDGQAPWQASGLMELGCPVSEAGEGIVVIQDQPAALVEVVEFAGSTGLSEQLADRFHGRRWLGCIDRGEAVGGEVIVKVRAARINRIGPAQIRVR